MAAGAYAGASSASEVRAADEGRRRFLGEQPSGDAGESALAAALVVGASYFAGALVPVLPVLFGARTVLPSVLSAGTMIVVVSALLAFLSGMNVRRRVVTNVLIAALAVLVSYAIGRVAKTLLGVSL
jgi:VIT1/CCC1 family predicted Fe2+/Mn2+ transporter